MAGSKNPHGGRAHVGSHTTGSSPSGSSRGSVKLVGSSTMTMPSHAPPPAALADSATAASAAVRARVTVVVRVNTRTGSPRRTVKLSVVVVVPARAGNRSSKMVWLKATFGLMP